MAKATHRMASEGEARSIGAQAFAHGDVIASQMAAAQQARRDARQLATQQGGQQIAKPNIRRIGKLGKSSP